ncbi:hypothetical protein SLEP1_g29404 [Rubroshorea leprosula]|uniref:Uncharacterized protein n=1 Tax=Rubroshorea leprosula TaxID=152421 RepID=A0AAV5JZB8_9ROSI|nr:hypothetical protein SLEP1_g29404 [Rubroshorea leprosula]
MFPGKVPLPSKICKGKQTGPNVESRESTKTLKILLPRYQTIS